MTRLLLRIVLGIVAVLVAWVLLAATLARLAMHDQVTEFVRQASRGHIDLLVSWLDSVPENRLQAELARLQPTYSYPLRIMRPTDGELPREVVRALPLAQFFIHIAGPTSRYQTCSIYTPLRKGRYILVLGPLPQFLPLSTAFRFAILASSVLVSGLVGFLLSLSIVRRIKRLEQVTVSFREGNLDARATDHGKDAIGTLARSFNQTAEQLQRLLNGHRSLFQAVSHELRTPTGNIAFALDLLKEDHDPRAIGERVSFMQREVEQLDDLIRELLEFARLDSGVDVLMVDAVAVEATVEAIIERLAPQRPELRVQTEGLAPDRVAFADRRLLRRALENVIRNAFAFARTTVKLRVEESATALTIDVEDDGPGIPVEERERVFEAFTRLDTSRSRQCFGTGLGLTITRRILDLHGGGVTADASPLGGAKLRTVWPRMAEEITHRTKKVDPA